MKWTNKGHQFDSLGEYLKENQEIYIYGAGEYGEKLYKILQHLEIDAKFIDGDKRKQRNGYLNQIVLSPIKFFSSITKCIVVVAASIINTPIILSKLRDNGYEQNINCFEMEYFLENILPIYSLYIKDKVVVNGISILPTTICNLNHYAWSNFTSYNNDKKHEVLENLKESLNCFFEAIDYLNFLSFSGGEPLLYPNIDEILTYIGENYNHKIQCLAISTNGTILSEQSTYEILKKYGFKVFINDYSKYVNKCKEILIQLQILLNSYNIDYTINEADYWIKLEPFNIDKLEFDKENLVAHRKKCGMPYKALRNGRLYSCKYASFAIKANMQQDTPNNWFNIKNLNQIKKREFVEFLMGYTEKGYIDCCKKCAGKMSSIIKPIGIQIPK